jgi:hypothetical protein
MSNTDLYIALADLLKTKNVTDQDGNPVNIVDGLFAIAQSLDRIALAIELYEDEPEEES